MKIPEHLRSDFTDMFNSLDGCLNQAEWYVEWKKDDKEPTVSVTLQEVPLFDDQFLEDDDQPQLQLAVDYWRDENKPLWDEVTLLRLAKENPKFLSQYGHGMIRGMMRHLEKTVEPHKIAAWFLFSYDTENPSDCHYELAAELLASDKDMAQSGDEWRVRLGEAIYWNCKGFAERLKKDGVAFNAKDDGENFVPQERSFYKYLETLPGSSAKRAAKAWKERNANEDRWYGFAFSVKLPKLFPRFAICLGEIALRDVIKPNWEKVQKHRPAVPIVVLGPTAEILGWQGGIEVKDKSLVNGKGVEVATISAAIVELIDTKYDALQSITAQRVWRSNVQIAHEQYYAGDADWRVIDFTDKGGIAAYAKAIGCPESNRVLAEIRDILRLGSGINILGPQGREAIFWIFRDSKWPNIGKRGDFSITIGDLLIPKVVHQFPKHIEKSLVPMVPLPPFTSKQKMGNLGAFQQFGIVPALVARRQEIRTFGGARLLMDHWIKLAKRFDLSEDEAKKFIDRLLHDGDDGSRMLDNTDGLWHLANNPAYGAARRFIDDGARCGERKKARMIKGKQLRGVESV